jgi:S-DNA-T family DNA segregation ATPase FtsK/SpoIIIE
VTTKSTTRSGSSGRGSSSKGRKPAKPSGRKPAPKKPARTSLWTHLAPWARDAFGIGLVVLALLSVLALWFDAAGFAGRWIEVGLRASVGSAAVVVPIIGLFWGLVLLAGAREESKVPMFVGFCLAFGGALAIVSILAGNPSPSAGYEGAPGAVGVGEAGGGIGALLGWPLAHAISPLGAGIVCGGVALLGVLIFTGTPLSVAWERCLELIEAARVSLGGGDDDEDEEEGRDEGAGAAPAAPEGGTHRVVPTDE